MSTLWSVTNIILNCEFTLQPDCSSLFQKKETHDLVSDFDCLFDLDFKIENQNRILLCYLNMLREANVYEENLQTNN